MKKYILGIDIGTESIRAAVFDETGGCPGFGVSENRTFHINPGWAEQSVNEWEESLITAMNKAILSSGVKPETIAGIGIDATCPTVVALDEHNRPLRNAIMWMDLRATREAAEIASTKNPALKVVGFGNVSPEWFPCKVLWLKSYEPEVYQKSKIIFDQPDWLSYILTGELSLNLNNITVRWFYGSETDGFPENFYQKIGLSDFLDKLPSRIVKPGECAGYLQKSIAEKTGLKHGIPVAGGGADAYIGVIGVNALKPGKMALITGSSHLQIGLVDNEFHIPGINGTFPNAILQDYQVVEAGQISTGSVVKWFKDNFVNSSITEQAGKSNSVYSVLDGLAAKIPQGSEGLLVLEHWQGNRTPWVDPASRGVIRGLTLSHTPVHVYRAILEGVAYGTAVILKKMEDKGISIEEIVACGGAANSDLWMQIHSDVTGKPITIPAECQAPSLGSAILASTAAGIYSSITEAADNMVKIKKVVEPDLSKTKEYQFYIDQYVKTYENLKKESKELVQRTEQNYRKG